MKAPCFFGQIALEVRHEPSHLQGRLHRQEKVIVVRENGTGVKLHSIESLGSAENPDQ
jgi:hypothetical protein